MLRDWTPHCNYQEKLRLKMLLYYETQRSRLVALDKSISKLYLLNLDNLLPVVKPLYPDSGRPAKNQQGIIRSLVLMLDQQVYSITNWALKVASDPLLFDICGFVVKAPAAASYYDFLIRFWRADRKLHLNRKKKVKKFTSKPRLKLKAGEKLKPNSTAHPFILAPVTMVLRFATAAQRESLIANAPEGSPTRMQNGDGIVTANSGSLAILFSMSPLQTAPMTFPFTSRWFRQAAMTVLPPSSPSRISINYIHILILKAL
ncbi:hypothetical protein [Petroclostridium xylanilyticum]|jgi:hypothetical protein|uniref:hypothetical protein n=1 Tax=Petroclostridium xylanilyticum TaxID=1792311 RepID=UPI000B989660|nr:hypothetical protein [Petroclostridium xylanilyticum]